MTHNITSVKVWLGKWFLFQTFDELDYIKDKEADIKDTKALLVQDGSMYCKSMFQSVRMQGLGNRFVVIRGPYVINTNKVKELSSPKTDGGADGVLVVTPVSDKEVKMRYWNADGSEAEMCGNGIRCVAKFAVDNNLVKAGEFTVETKVGKLKVLWDGKDSNKIEAQIGTVKIVAEPMLLEGRYFYVVDVGNPHCITFVDTVEDIAVDVLGPIIERNNNFPHRTNVEFVEVVSNNTIKLRVWERGVGETPACGTGMVAAARLSKEVKKTQLPVTVVVPGGKSQIWLDKDGYCRMIGPAEYLTST